MAKKQRSGDPSDVYFDTKTKAVLTRTSHNTMASVKEQLARVREVIPQLRKDDMVLVLEHFDGDVAKTIQAFTEGGAEDILKEWNMPYNRRKTGNNVGKKTRKRRNKQPAGSPEEDVAVSGSPQEEHIPNNNNIEKPNDLSTDITREKPSVIRQDPNPVGKATSDVGATAQQPKKPQSAKPVQTPKSQQRKPQSPPSNTSNQLQDTQSQPRGHPGNNTQRQSQEPRDHPMQAQRQRKSSKEQRPPQASGQTAPHSAATAANNKQTSKPIHNEKRTGKDEAEVRGQRSGQSSAKKESPVSEGGKRERNISESSSVIDPSKTKKTGHALEKSSKDLQRTVVSLTRHKNLLADEIEKAEKRLKKAMDDARMSLNSREEEMMRQIQEVKRQSTSKLDERQHRAFELKQEISREASKTDKEILELRADIKHFVSERKIDEEIGRSSRFTGNPDALQEAIKQFGEVLTIKSGYTARRPSITSLTSVDSLSRPTSISDSGLFSRSASTIEGSVRTDAGTPATPMSPTSPTSPDADIDSDVAKMAAKMQRSLQGQRNRGPRNPRQQGSSPRRGQQGNRPGQGQSPSKEGSRQDQRGNRGRQDRASNNQSNQPQRTADDKPHHESGQRQQGGYRNDRPRNDRQQDNRNKDKNIRRREQYRRRHDQGGDSKQGGGGDEKQEGGAYQDKTNQDKTNQDKTKVTPVPRSDNIPIPRNAPSSPRKKPDVAVPVVNGTSNHDASPDKPKLEARPNDKAKSPAKKENDAPPSVNGNADISPQTEALPQRKPREDRGRKTVEAVVKEVTSMNGMMNGEISTLLVNGES